MLDAYLMLAFTNYRREPPDHTAVSARVCMSSEEGVCAQYRVGPGFVRYVKWIVMSILLVELPS